MVNHTVLIGGDVENLVISHKLANRSRAITELNRSLPRAALTIALLVSFHAQIHIIHVLFERRFLFFL